MLRLATYNVQNLFTDAAGTLDRSAVSLKALLRMLELLDADVVALQEVGGATALNRLNEGLKTPYPFAYCGEGNSRRNIQLAYLSRWPLTLHSHRTLPLTDPEGAALSDYPDALAATRRQLQPLRFQRDILRADLVTETGAELCLLNVHLKSRAEALWRQLSSDTIRAAEIRALARVATTCAASVPTALLGDFNDSWTSDPMAPLRALRWIDVMQWEVARSRGARARSPGTYWKKRHARLDFVHVSPQLHAHLVPGSARTHSGALGQRASDHYPVSVDLQLSPIDRSGPAG
ncbi:MAG: endonuclease/exonuclease/phosphatase family protein [Pseudomonadota bacterium]